MHRAVEVHAWDAVEVRLEHVTQRRGILDGGGALVVDDHVVAFAVGRVGVQRERRLGGLVGRVHVLDDDIGARLEAGLEEILLRDVVVAAAAGDEEDAERLGRRGGRGRGAERRRGEEGRQGVQETGRNHGG